MKESNLVQLHTNKLKSTNPQGPAPYTQADYLTVSFSPAKKCIHVKWLKPIGGEEYRQGLRIITRSAVFLRAELALTDVRSLTEISLADQEWTATFLRGALAKSPLKRSACLISDSNLHMEAMHTLVARTGNLPYEVGLFQDEAAAKRWLLEGQPDSHTAEDDVSIPLNFNLKLLKWKTLLQPDNGKKTTAGQIDASPEQPLPYAPGHSFVKLRTDFVGITMDQSESLMSINWIKPPESRQYRYGMLKAGRALIDSPIERVLLNNQRLGILTLEDQAWLVSVSIQLLPRTGIKKLAVVTSHDALQQMSSDSIGCKIKEAQLPYDTRYFLSVEEAREWLFLSDNAEPNLS